MKPQTPYDALMRAYALVGGRVTSTADLRFWAHPEWVQFLRAYRLPMGTPAISTDPETGELRMFGIPLLEATWVPEEIGVMLTPAVPKPLFVQSSGMTRNVTSTSEPGGKAPQAPGFVT